MRIAGRPKCASDPRVVCAFQYGSKSERGLSPKPNPGELHLLPGAAVFRPHSVECQTGCQDENKRFLARTTAGKPKCLHGWSANRSHDPRQALRRRWRLSFGGPAAPPPRARNLMSIVTGAPDVASARSARSIGDRHGPPVGELGRRYADGDQDRAALTHRDAPPRREAGRRPRPRAPPERGSSGVQRGGVPRQPLGYTRGRLALPH